MQGETKTMKRPIPMVLGIVAVVLVVWIMTKIANESHFGQDQDRSFWLEGQRVLQCTPTEITLVDKRFAQTHLTKDESWPDCSVFQTSDPLDLFLSRGEKTHFIRSQRSAWWH
jgi:hypothetical protein